VESFGSGGTAQGKNQEAVDDEHLRLLRIGYFVSAGLNALFIPFGALYAGMGFFMLPFAASAHPGGATPAAIVPLLFAVIGGIFMLLAAASVILKLLTAARLKERRSRMLCLVTAGLACMEVPWGTALGVLTFVVLDRPSVRAQFIS
jgi:hypothetical protein